MRAWSRAPAGRAPALAVLGLLLLALPARAQLSPGPLSRFHADLEGIGSCTRCHEAGQRLSPAKCLACHEALGARVAAGRGLHARPGHEACETCHAEHQGRDYELVWWGKEGRAAFDHRQSGWGLAGAHARLGCERCHGAERLGSEAARALREGRADPARTFLGLRADCAACHRDPHQGRLGAACGSCHGEEGWDRTAGFDHARTRFVLVGRHRDVPCVKCHAPREDGAAPAGAERAAAASPRLQLAGLRFGSCADCHRDPHQGRLGADCARCHDPRGWASMAAARFDHDRTRYPLRGRHTAVPCGGCHRPDRAGHAMPFGSCTDCHRDEHGGQFASPDSAGAGCHRCHSVNGFSPALFTVDDHARTRYPLAGAHLAVPCVACHARPRAGASVAEAPFRFPSTRCGACHSDPHAGEADPWIAAGGCEACHRVESWRLPVYNHDATRFRLEGRHAGLGCGACHAAASPGAARGSVRLRGLPMACEGCHRDAHAGQFREGPAPGESAGATPCQRCHSPASWRAERFDHGTTLFPLEGAHRRARCEQCHRREGEGEGAFMRYRPLDTACQACHAAKPATSGAAAGSGEERP